MSLNHLSTWNRVTSSIIWSTNLLFFVLISIYSMFTNILTLNYMSSFLIIKLNLFENFSCIWQWWQYRVKYSISRESTSCLARSSIWYSRRVEKWSKQRCKRRNFISIRKHGFSSRKSTIRIWIEIFKVKRHAHIVWSSNINHSSYRFEQCQQMSSESTRLWDYWN